MNGERVRVLAMDGMLRAVAVESTAVARGLAKNHDAGPVGAVALSRAASACLLMGALLKGRQQVGLQINGDGPLGELYAVADADGHVRATVHDPRAEAADPRSLAAALGTGRFTVIKRLSEEPAYRGTVELRSGEIGQDLALYFAQSEQVPTAVGLGERLSPEGVEAAGGYLVQAMPGASEAALALVEARLEEAPAVGALFGPGTDPEAVLADLLGPVQVLERTPVELRCQCSRPHFARALIALGREELERLTVEQAITELECHFCRTRYTFDREQIGALLLGAGGR